MAGRRRRVDRRNRPLQHHGLHRGAARIHFYGRSFVGEWYDDQVSKSSADDVPIPAGSTVDGIDAALARPSSVSGSVTTEAGQPAAVRVAAYQDQGGRWLSVGDVSTDALGNFRIDGLRTGDVRLRFTGPDIVGEWWQDKTSFSSADSIPVAEETDVTGHQRHRPVLRAHLRPRHRRHRVAGLGAGSGCIAGRGCGGSGPAAPTPAGTAGTPSPISPPASTPRTTTPTATSRSATTTRGRCSRRPTSRSASGQQVSGIDAALSTGSTLSGVVKAADGTPIQGVTVRASRYEAWWDDWDDARPVRTGADGSYSVGMLRDGAYQVEFVGKGDYFGEWYDNARHARVRQGRVACPRTVRLPASTPSSRPAAASPAPSPRGTARRWPASGCPHTSRTDTVAGTSRAVVWPTRPAAYAVAGLAEGTYRIGFSDPAQVYLGGYWRHELDFDRAASVSVRWGETTSGINGVLIRGSRITGAVRRTDGSGVSGAQVAAYAGDGDGGWTYLARVTADAAGAYDLPGLPAGAYRVRFSDPHRVLAPEWWDDATDVASARSIQLDWQQVRTGVGAVLQPAGAISGTVSETGAGALNNIAVVAYARDASGGWAYVDRVSTDALGRYSIGGVGTGTYRLKAVDKWPYSWSGADRGEYLDEWYRDAYSLTAATDVPVTAGADTAGIDIGLGRPGRIAGRVTDAKRATASARRPWRCAGSTAGAGVRWAGRRPTPKAPTRCARCPAAGIASSSSSPGAEGMPTSGTTAPTTPRRRSS